MPLRGCVVARFVWLAWLQVDLRVRELYRIMQSSLEDSCRDEAGVQFWQGPRREEAQPAGVGRGLSSAPVRLFREFCAFRSLV